LCLSLSRFLLFATLNIAFVVCPTVNPHPAEDHIQGEHNRNQDCPLIKHEAGQENHHTTSLKQADNPLITARHTPFLSPNDFFQMKMVIEKAADMAAAPTNTDGHKGY